jgi:hypothetical protein
MRFERSENGSINTLLAQPISNIVVVGLHALAVFPEGVPSPRRRSL